MKRALFFLFSLCILFPGFAQEEKVYTFRSQVTVDVSGYISVREEIGIFAGGKIFKRGITRALPLTRSDKDGNRVAVEYDIVSARKNGEPEPFFSEREGDDRIVYVGKSDRLLDAGWYTYTLDYITSGQIVFLEEYDELSWNVNGLSDHTLDTVTVVVRLPEGAEIVSYRSYVGEYGSTKEDCRAETLPDGSLYLEAVSVAPQQMLTLSVGFVKGVVTPPATGRNLYSGPVPSTFFDRNGLPIASAILFLLLLTYYFFTWRRYGVDPPRPVVIPQFSPPEGLSPASVGMLHKEKYWNDLITPAIVNLAVKGFLRISESERPSLLRRKDRVYTLVRLKEKDDTLPQEESLVLERLFKQDNEVVLDGKYNAAIAELMDHFRRELNRQFRPLLREGANRKFMVLPWIILIFYLCLLFYFVRFEPVRQVGLYIVVALFSFPVVILLSLILRKRVGRSRIGWFSCALGVALGISSLSLLLIFRGDSLSMNTIGFIVGFPLIVIGFMAYSFLIRRPDERKLYLQSQIEGLKIYMDTAEEKLLQFFNPPTITPEVFEQLLPYAIALGMEDIWGEKFEKRLLGSMQQPQPYQPPWFAGTVMPPARFGHMLSSTLSNTVNHAATPPHSSSSGGGNWSSGSFGGGFSGMGGGGGRVGGW